MQVFDTLRLVLTTPLSDVEVGQSTGLSRATVRRYRRLADQKQFMWSDLAHLGPTAVRDLFNRKAGRPTLPAPDLALLADQLQAKGTTLQLLWEDYRRADPHNTLSYSQLAARLKGFRDTQPSSMRQHHRPGERVFVDYSGLRPYYFDRTTQKKTFVELFVGVLGASSFIYATCTPSQKVPDFIKAHVGMLDYFGGVPMVVVPDNLKSAVVKTGKTPTIQRAYADYARHYSMAVVPARPYKPKDKAVAEASVKVVQQRIVARMQSQRFYSLEEVNVAVALFLDELNNRPMVKDGQSRRARFDALERPALRPLPEQPYEYAEWLPVPTVPRDYHVAIDGHFYSVPHRLVGQRVDARVLDAAIELFHEHHLVARHSRSHVTGAHTTIAGHQPDAHRAQAERTPDGMVAWSKESGAHIHRFIKAQLDRAQPYLGLPACDTVKRLAERHGTEAINRACKSALELRTPTVSALRRLVSTATTSVKTEPRSSNARSARAIRQGVRHAD